MDWQQLKGFYTIVKLGNVTRAADALFRTQSALSQQVSKLEADLNCILFNRIGKSFHLTEAGEYLFKFAEQTFINERQLLDNIEKLNNESSGSIYLSAPYAVLDFLLGDILAEFTRQYPKISLHIFEKNPHDCIDMLIHGDVNFAFIHDSTVPEGVDRYLWRTCHYNFVTPKDHPLTRIRDPTLKDFIEYPINVSGQHVKFSAREKLSKECYRQGLKYRVALETPNILLNIRYVIRGIGISFILCYDEIVQKYSDRLAFLPVRHLFPDETISIIRKRSKYLAQHEEDFIRFLLAR